MIFTFNSRIVIFDAVPVCKFKVKICTAAQPKLRFSQLLDVESIDVAGVKL